VQRARPCLPFDDTYKSLNDIAAAISMIQMFTRNMNFEEFREDPKTVAAVERKLLVISGAAIRLGEHAPAFCPDIRWRNMRGIGKWIRHQCDRVGVETVWATVVADLPPLSGCITRTLAERSQAEPNCPMPD
jgi:uncharacterized protein with HEPN domain